MSRTALFVTAAVLAGIAGGGRATAADPPTPDLTGRWDGKFASMIQRELAGDAAMSVDAQEAGRCKGKLAIGKLLFDFGGEVTADPPSESDPPSGSDPPGEADPPGEHKPFRVLIMGTTPPEPDRGEADPPQPDMVFVWGTIQFADPPSPDADPPDPDTDPPEPDRRPLVIEAEYMILRADGRADFGIVKLAK